MNLLKILGWVFGCIFIITGMAQIAYNVLVGAFSILVGLILIPVTRGYVQKMFENLKSKQNPEDPNKKSEK